jgi:predicted RNA-binding Zn-ribbon protein involved in translation (DUF1610 family)
MKASRAVIVISKRQWERFMASVEELVDAHSELLKLVRDLKSRNSALKEQLRDALASRTRQIAERITMPIDERLRLTVPEREELHEQLQWGNQLLVYLCTNCGRELVERSKYCDRCGRQLNWFS